MKLRLLFVMLIFSVWMENLNAQNVEVKKDKVLFDGKEILSIDWSGWSLETKIYELNTENEIIFANLNPNGTPKYRDDDYLQIHFLTLDKKMEMSDKNFGKGLVKWLFKNNIFDSNGNLIPEKVDILIKKYDEKITERTILRN